MTLIITPGKVSAFFLMIAFSFLFSSNAIAGGPWVLGKGQSTLSLGFSRKVGEQRWAPMITGNTTTPTDYSDDVITYELIHNPDSTTVDGKFHDFRYYYFQGAFGICKNLELDIALNYLVGRELQEAIRKPGNFIPI